MKNTTGGNVTINLKKMNIFHFFIERNNV